MKKILIVDDEALNIFLLTELLEDEYDVHSATSGIECLDAIRGISPDLILMDVSMPVLNGYETCELIKKMPEFIDVPLIYLTAHAQIKDEVQGLATGAVDYITKPFSGLVLKLRIKSHLALRRVTKELVYEQSRVGDIVNKMMSDSRFCSDNIERYSEGLAETNGDIVLSAKLSEDKQLVLVGDFTGHGLSAAVCGSVVSSVFYLLAQKGCSAIDICHAINSELHHKLPPYMFFVACLVEVDSLNKTAKIINLGLPSVLSLKNGKVNHHYASRSLPLGIGPTIDMTPIDVSFTAGDMLVVFTDGITETKREDGTMLGEAFVEDLVTSQYKKGQGLAQAFHKMMAELAVQNRSRDDVTLVQICG